MVQIVCYNYNKPEYLARNYRNGNRPTTQKNLTEEDLVVMIIEINIIGGLKVGS